MAAHAHLKNEFMEDEKSHHLMRWLKCEYTNRQPAQQPAPSSPSDAIARPDRTELTYNELAHEIMALFVLHKLILQPRMRSHPVGPFVYFHTSCVRTAKALARQRGCAGLPEHSLVAYVIRTIISRAGSFCEFTFFGFSARCQRKEAIFDCGAPRRYCYCVLTATRGYVF